MLSGKKALVIEDDRHICEVVKAILELQNVNLDFCYDGSSGLERGITNPYDLIVLDIMLPKMTGLEVCRKLREHGYVYPIVMLTARVDEMDKVLGLELGADDYITKPFSPREFVARCKAVLRRFERAVEIGAMTSLGGLLIQREQHSITYQGVPIDFARREFDLLVFLSEHPNQLFTRDQLLDYVWGFGSYPETRTVDEHVKRVRNKLASVGCESVSIKTIWGVGYRLEVTHNAD